MDWGKVIFVFFTLMSMTSTVGYLYDNNSLILFIAAMVNVISTILKVGVRNLLAAEMLASSIVADLHLIPAFFYSYYVQDASVAMALALGAFAANIFSIILVLIESARTRDTEY